jgi:hypothetical protein
MARRSDIIDAILAGTLARFAARDPRRTRILEQLREAAAGSKLEDSAWLGRLLKETDDGDLGAATAGPAAPPAPGAEAAS